MFFGGNPGAGKTHLATAIVGKLIRELDVVYAVWPQMAQALKACVMDDEAYDRQMKRYQRAQVLLLDDFLKPGRDRKGNEEGASAADMRLLMWWPGCMPGGSGSYMVGSSWVSR